MREARRALARSNGFGYFPRKESDPAVKAGTKRHSKRDNGYAYRQQPHRQRASRQWNPMHRFCCRFTADRDQGRSYRGVRGLERLNGSIHKPDHSPEKIEPIVRRLAPIMATIAH